MKNIKNGPYTATIGVRHNSAAFQLDMQVNGVSIFKNKWVIQKGKDHKNGSWTEASVAITVSNGEVQVTDNCETNCDFSWSRITTFSIIEGHLPVIEEV